MMSIQRLAETVDSRLTREAGLYEWKQAVQQNINYLLRAQEQTDKKLNALLEAQQQIKQQLEESKSQPPTDPTN